MARIWTELADPKRHVDYMSDWSVGGQRILPPRDNLLTHRVLLIEVCGFTFQFQSKQQLQKAIDFFSHAIHKSSMEPNIVLEHYWHPWYQRLPKGLTAHSKRVRILAALRQAQSSRLVAKQLLA